MIIIFIILNKLELILVIYNIFQICYINDIIGNIINYFWKYDWEYRKAINWKKGVLHLWYTFVYITGVKLQ